MDINGGRMTNLIDNSSLKRTWYERAEVIKIIQDCRNEFNLIVEEVIGLDEETYIQKWNEGEGKAFDEITRRLNLIIDAKLEDV